MNKHNNWTHYPDFELDAPETEKIRRKHKNVHGRSNLPPHSQRPDLRDQAFRCIHCKAFVPVNREVSGVNNRNHCPWCLRSRHVDGIKPGDRGSSCRSRMTPIGVTLKRTIKKYNGARQGELMLIHHCEGCGKLSINRIAGDDDAQMIFNLFQSSIGLLPADLAKLAGQGIQPLQPGDFTLVFTQLFGWQAVLEEFVQNQHLSIPVDVE